MNQSDYERLKAMGYTEEEIEVVLENYNRLNVSSRPLGPSREDRGVTVRPGRKDEFNTSSIMMGYNKQGISLENGEFVSFEEFEKGLKQELASDEPDVVYVCKKTEKIVTEDTIIAEIFKEAIKKGAINLGEDNKISNQSSASVRIVDPTKSREISKGIFMLGNRGIELPNGDYLLTEEIERALNDYVRMAPPKKIVVPPVGPEIDVPEIDPPTGPGIDSPEETYTVVERRTEKRNIFLPIVTALVIFLSGLKVTDRFIEEIVRRTELDLHHSISYSSTLSDEDIMNTALNNIREIQTGQSFDMEKGVAYYESSDYKYGGASAKGEFGSVLRPEGKYVADAFSILHNGEIVSVEFEEGKTIADTIEETARKLNVPIEELETMIHIGGPASGWINADDLLSAYVNNESQVRPELDDDYKYEGVIEDFTGDFIKIDADGDEVLLKVTDDDGTLLQSGSVVVGSDGKEYCLDDLRLVQTEYTETIGIPAGEKVEWSISNITAQEALAAAALALAATLLSKRKVVEEEVDMTADEIRELVENAKNEFSTTSEFTSAVKTLTQKEPIATLESAQTLENALIDREVTVEEIENLGGVRK